MNLYHGTNVAFENIDWEKVGTATVEMGGITAPLGFWMTDSLEWAQTYAQNAANNNGGEPVVLVVEVDVDDFGKTDARFLEDLVEAHGAEAVREMLAAEATGGIVDENEYTEYVALSNDVILSISIL